MTAKDLTIRSAERTDAATVARIYVDSWNQGFGDLMPPRQIDPKLVARWQSDLSSVPPHRWWVAELRGAIAGFAGICPSRDPVDPGLGELDTIAVDPPAWRRGVGRGLMATALAQLAADGYCEAVLWTLAGYERGKHFYESTGWRLDGATRGEGRQVLYRHTL